VLTSTKNPKVAAALRLKKRAFRDEDRRFLVEGARGVDEAVRADALEVLYAVEELHPSAVLARQRGVDVVAVSEELMAKLTSTVTPPGLVGVARYVDVALDAVPEAGCVALLHEVRDPGNAGTVLRSADAAGASAVVFSATSVDAYNPKTVRAAAGSVFHLPVVREVPADVAIAHLRDRGFRILAMDAAGAVDLYAADLADPVAFVFGNEAHGLPDEVAGLADATVRVPHAGAAESLNLAAAASVCLFEVARRRAPASATLESLIAAAAHDIRSPLTAMKGFGFALEKRWDMMTEEQRALMLTGIVHDADRMDTITRQLVDAARILGRSLEPFPEEVDLPKLVGDVAAQQRRDPEHPEIRWLGSAEHAVTDPTRLRTTILAFLESLVWWAHEGPIDVRADLRDGRLHLVLSRAGTELDTAAADALFLPRRPGTGAGSKIGMFVARGVAEAQGGRAWGDVVGDVLSFHVEVPAPSPTEDGAPVGLG
jgi:TrmH family RNA methyltransferase